MKTVPFVLTVVLIARVISAETHISGDISTVSFDAAGSPYFVDQDLLVPQGKHVIISEGCVFLFKEFTTLTVSGELVVEGTAGHPVVFTSANDSTYNKKSKQLANPFDWNGVLINAESPRVYMKNFALTYSVYGVRSKSENVFIENGLFKQNGQYGFTINERIQPVADGVTYTYRSVVPTTPQGYETATLLVKTDPPGAIVYLDGKAGDTPSPVTFKKLGPGSHALKASTGNLGAEQEVALTQGEVRELFVRLKPMKTLLEVKSTPPGAEVYLNAKPERKSWPARVTPVQLTNPRTGPLSVTLFKPGFADTAISLDVQSGRLNSMFVQLREDRQAASQQAAFVKERGKVRIRFVSLVSSGVLAVAGGTFLALAQSDYASRDQAKDYINSSILPNDPKVAEKQSQYDKAAAAGNAKRNGAIVLLGCAAAAGIVGIVLYF